MGPWRETAAPSRRYVTAAPKGERDENVFARGTMQSGIDVRRWHRLRRFLEGRERQGPLARRLRVGRLGAQIQVPHRRRLRGGAKVEKGRIRREGEVQARPLRLLTRITPLYPEGVCRPKHGRHRVNPQWQLLADTVEKVSFGDGKIIPPASSARAPRTASSARHSGPHGNRRPRRSRF